MRAIDFSSARMSVGQGFRHDRALPQKHSAALTKIGYSSLYSSPLK